MIKKASIIVSVFLLGFMLTACDSSSSVEGTPYPVVTIEIEGFGVIELVLFPDVAPNTVRNFVSLIESGYYDGVGFHRIIENFMVQGGRGDALSCRIEGEFTNNNFTNDIAHVRGVISMARTMDPNSATGQFFIVHQTSPHLDGNYASFGMMTKGWDVLDAIASIQTGANDAPTEAVVITRMTVNTFGVDYQPPVCYDS